MSTRDERARRRRLITELVASEPLHSQEEVVERLAAHGVSTTQTTVSRDLDELGIVKVRGAGGQLVYRATADPGPAAARAQLEETLRRYVRSGDHSANLVVLRTPPAGAPPVASAIDLAELPGVLATVAGDDTVLVVATETVGGRTLARQLLELAALTTTT